MPETIEISYWVILGWMLFGIFVIVVFVGLWTWVRRFFRRPELHGTSRQDLQKKWQSIEELLSRNDEMSAKLAVIEADKLLDHALKSMGLGGETMGERLKLVVYKYPRVRAAWQGHSIRNRLVHETSYHLSRGAARGAVTAFRESLKELGVL